MKKNIYSIAAAFVFLGFILTSCHKENLKPSDNQSNNSSKVASGGGSDASAPTNPSDPSHPAGGCPHKSL